MFLFLRQQELGGKTYKSLQAKHTSRVTTPSATVGCAPISQAQLYQGTHLSSIRSPAAPLKRYQPTVRLLSQTLLLTAFPWARPASCRTVLFRHPSTSTILMKNSNIVTVGIFIFFVFRPVITALFSLSRPRLPRETKWNGNGFLVLGVCFTEDLYFYIQLLCLTKISTISTELNFHFVSFEITQISTTTYHCRCYHNTEDYKRAAFVTLSLYQFILSCCF